MAEPLREIQIEVKNAIVSLFQKLIIEPEHLEKEKFKVSILSDQDAESENSSKKQ